TTDRICRECEYNWDSRGRLFCNLSVLARICDDHVNLEPHEFRGDVGRTVVTAFRPAHIDVYVAAFDPAKFAEPRHNGGEPHVGSRRRASAEETNGGEVRHLLRPRCERPCRCAAEQRYELAALHLRGHSMTSSARASSVSGTVRPSVLAVLKLITNSSFVDC